MTQVAAATSSQDPKSGWLRVAALRGLVEVLEASRWRTPGPGLVLATDRSPPRGHQAGRAPQVRRPPLRLPEVAKGDPAQRAGPPGPGAGKSGGRRVRPQLPGPEHLVLGVLRYGDSGASRVLRSFGVTLRAPGRRWADWPTAAWCPGRALATPSCWAHWGSTWTRSDAAPSRASVARPWGGRSGRRPGRDGVGLSGCRARPWGIRRC